MRLGCDLGLRVTFVHASLRPCALLLAWCLSSRGRLFDGGLCEKIPMKKLQLNRLVRTLACAAALSGLTLSASAAAETLKVGTDATFTPFEFLQEDGSFAGFDVELIRAIGKQAGFDVEFVNMPIDKLIPAVQASQIDIAISDILITDERSKLIDFSTPYITSGLTMLILEEDVEKYPTVDSLKGEPLCAQVNTTGADTAEKLSPGKVLTFQTGEEALKELRAKKCLGMINDRPINLYFLNRTQEATGVVEIKDILNLENVGIVVRKGNHELKERINIAMQKLRIFGTYDQIYDKWFKPANKKH